MVNDTIYDALLRHLMGPLVQYYDDPTITEIMINGPDEVFIDGRGGVRKVAETLRDSAALRALARVILQFSGKRLDPHDLSLEARTPSRARVHIVQDPAARAGITVAIRQFATDPPTIEDLEASGSLSTDAITYLRDKVVGHRNIIISGGTGTGKTTLLGILSRMMDPDERILTIEDVAELDLRMPHVVQLESQLPDDKGRGGITIRELFRAALRMRPDRILVGECRGGEALDMIQAMNSGHAGSLSTVHADDPARALSRLETLCLMSEIDVPIIAVRRQIIEAIDIVVQVQRIGGKRLVMEISEVSKEATEKGAYPVIPVFFRASAEDPLIRV
ncbi:MAG: CpaF family protein [Silicimonas sp.]|nr:CpaF family protein [Silicimonas sp.]